MNDFINILRFAESDNPYSIFIGVLLYLFFTLFSAEVITLIKTTRWSKIINNLKDLDVEAINETITAITKDNKELKEENETLKAENLTLMSSLVDTNKLLLDLKEEIKGLSTTLNQTQLDYRKATPSLYVFNFLKQFNNIDLDRVVWDFIELKKCISKGTSANVYAVKRVISDFITELIMSGFLDKRFKFNSEKIRQDLEMLISEELLVHIKTDDINILDEYILELETLNSGIYNGKTENEFKKTTLKFTQVLMLKAITL